MLKFIRAGMYTSVQDGGRGGQRQWGISRCGALDKPAMTIANLLVGNAPEAAALEITLGQIDVQFSRHCWFALTGAACEATLDGAPATIYAADGLFRGVFVPAGGHEVVFAFRPRSYRLGAIVSLLGLGVALAGVVMLMKRERDAERRRGARGYAEKG